MYVSDLLRKELDMFKRANAHYWIQAGRRSCTVENAADDILFMAMAASSVMDYTEDGFFEDFVITDKCVSGKNETHIDAYALIETENSSVKNLHVFQFKLHNNEHNAASPADLLNLATCVSNSFLHPSLSDVAESSNDALNEIREKYENFIGSRRNRRIVPTCHLITNTQGMTISNKQSIEDVLARFLSDKQQYGFNVQVYGERDLLDLAQNGKIRVGDESLELIVDNGSNSYRLEDNSARTSMGLPKKVVIGMCNVNEFIRLQNKYHHNQLYSENIRLYLGDRGSVNKDIIRTITSNESIWFPYMNNGISIICDDLRIGSPSLQKHVVGLTMTNMQIINGCQTVNALYSAKYSPVTSDDFRASSVLVRIYEIDPSQQDFKNNIIKATNNQNAVKSYSLLANDPIQVRIAEIMSKFGVIYDRKGEGKDVANGKKVISMVSAALSYRAVYLFMAKNLRSGLGKTRVFQKSEYEKVFDPTLLDLEDQSGIVKQAIRLMMSVLLLDKIRDLIFVSVDKYKSLPIFKKSAYYLAGLMYAKNKSRFEELMDTMLADFFENNEVKLLRMNYVQRLEAIVSECFDEVVELYVPIYEKNKMEDELTDIDNMLKSQKFADSYLSLIYSFVRND